MKKKIKDEKLEKTTEKEESLRRFFNLEVDNFLILLNSYNHYNSIMIFSHALLNRILSLVMKSILYSTIIINL